mgnify:CR=1 FL=1|jgi:hypothetical protein
MAPKACSPYAKRRFIRSIKEESEVLGGYIENLAMLERNVNPGKGYVGEMYDRATQRVNAMLAIPMENVIGWLADQGALNIKTLKSGEQVLMNVKGDPQDLGEWTAAMQTYLQGQAGGIRQLADNFIVAAQTGQGAVVQGLELAKQLAWMGNLGEVILGYDQSLGRGLLAKKYAQNGFSPQELAEKIAKNRADRARVNASEAGAQYSDKIGDILDRLNNPSTKNGALDDLYELAEQVKFMNNPMNIIKGTTGLKMAGGVWTEYFINGMLSNPATWAANAAGVLWAPLRMGAQVFGAGMMRAAAAAGVGDQQLARGVWEMSMAQVMSIQSSLRDAALMGWQALETGRSVYWDDASLNSTRSISGQNLNTALNKIGRDPVGEGVYETVDWVGRFIRIPSRILTGTDEFAKIIAQRGEVAQRAIKRALDDGVDMNNKELVKNYLEAEAKMAFEIGPQTRFGNANLGKLRTIYDNASTQQQGFGGRSISRAGDEATFQERTGTAATQVSSMIGNVLDNPVGQLMRPFLPFVRTPMNIIGQGVMQATPVGPIKDLLVSAGTNRLSPTGIVIDMQQKMLQSPTETARISGQIALMTATMGTLTTMAATGQMTGGGPDRWGGDRGPQARLRQQVWEENNEKYSIKINDDIVLPIEKFPEPVATLMRIAADVGAASAYMTQEEKDNAFMTLVAVSATGLYNSSALTGFDRLFAMLRDEADFDTKMAGNVQYWFATQTPMAGMMSYLNKQVDPYARAYQTTNTKYLLNFEELFGRGILGKVADRFPGGSDVKPVQVDQLYGEPVPITPGVGPEGMNPLGDAIPFLPRKGPKDAAWQAVWEMAGSWSDYSPNTVELTVGEQQKLNAIMGKLRIRGKTLSQAIMELRRRPEVETMVTQRGLAAPAAESGAARELAKLRTTYGKAALAAMMRDNVDLQRRAALTGQLKEEQRSNNMQAAESTSQQLRQLLEIAGRQ